MPYIEVADIERELGLDFSAPGIRPSEDEVAEIIAEVEAELNGYAAALGYTVPVTDARAAAMLAQAAIWGVCARVLGAYSGATADLGPRESAYWERYRDFCDRLTANPGLLSGAKRAASKVDGYRPKGPPEFSMDDVW